jgi:hypothetical protein
VKQVGRKERVAMRCSGRGMGKGEIDFLPSKSANLFSSPSAYRPEVYVKSIIDRRGRIRVMMRTMCVADAPHPFSSPGN